jgi:hypothetical protein
VELGVKVGRPRKIQPDNKAYKKVKAYSETFSTESGLAVLRDMRKTYFDRQSYSPGDPYATAFAEGQRSVVADLLSFLLQSKHPELFLEESDEFTE